MVEPRLIIVTGRPGSGKTTLSERLGDELGWPVVSRDSVKESLLTEKGISHTEAGETINLIASQAFFAQVGLMTSKNSLVIEAAFQQSTWQASLDTYQCPVRLIVCDVPVETAIDRFVARRDERRVYFHGDDLDASKALIQNYQNPQLDVPTLVVRTRNTYQPTLLEIVTFCKG